MKKNKIYLTMSKNVTLFVHDVLLNHCFKIQRFRPPGTLVPGGLIFYCWCFVSFLRPSMATVSSTHAGASSERWYQRYLRTLQGPGPTKPTTFLGHRSPTRKERLKNSAGRLPCRSVC